MFTKNLLVILIAFMCCAYTDCGFSHDKDRKRSQTNQEVLPEPEEQEISKEPEEDVTIEPVSEILLVFDINGDGVWDFMESLVKTLSTDLSDSLSIDAAAAIEYVAAYVLLNQSGVLEGEKALQEIITKEESLAPSIAVKIIQLNRCFVGLNDLPIEAWEKLDILDKEVRIALGNNSMRFIRAVEQFHLDSWPDEVDEDEAVDVDLSTCGQPSSIEEGN